MSTAGKVIVVGVENGSITDSGLGYQVFDSLEAAQVVFPDLDPLEASERFTKASPETREGITMRFETWAANDLYSL